MKNIGINLIFKKIKIFNKVDFVKACLYMFENYSSIEKNEYNILNKNISFNVLFFICNHFCDKNKDFDNLLLNKIEEINKLKQNLLVYKLNDREKKKMMPTIKILFKDYFDLLEKINWNESKLKELQYNLKFKGNIDSSYTNEDICILVNDDAKKIFECAKFYAKNVLNKSRSNSVIEIMNTKNYQIFTKLMKLNIVKDIKQFTIDNYDKILVNQLLDKLIPFIKNYSIVENIRDLKKLESIRGSLERKLLDIVIPSHKKITENILSDKSYKKEQIRVHKNEKLSKKYNLIESYLVDSLDINIFCSNNNITLDEFDKVLKYIESHDYKLAKMCRAKIKEDKKKEIQKIARMIKNGIKTKNGIREFDLLDYYLNTYVSFGVIRNVINEIEFSKEELESLRVFLKKYMYTKFIVKETIYKERVTVLLNNLPYVITKEDKDIVFEFLEENNIPLSDKTYIIALRRYLNNELLEQKTNEKQLQLI